LQAVIWKRLRAPFGNKFYCFENFKAEFLSVRQGSTMYEMYDKKVLSLIQTKKYKIVEPCLAYRE